MDFLVLMMIYLVIFIIGSLALLYRDAAILCSGPIGTLREMLVNTISNVVPSSLKYILIKIGSRLLYTRTCFFQVIFIVLCLLGHAVWVVDMIPILVQHYPNQNHTFWPFVAVFTNYYFLHKAWITDPGEITQSNVDRYVTIYKYDEILYNKDVCSTCKTVKPARSKHCSVCNRCVHRFDHHCIWTNNCVGAYTHRYFILFMVTLIAMFLQGIYVGSWCIMDFAEDIRLFNASFIGDDGSIHPITFSVAFQHLFMQLPRLVFLVVGLSVLTILVIVFLCQHVYFIITNQTTNETYKIKNIDWNSVQRDCVVDLKHGCVKDDGNNELTEAKHTYYRPYDQGILKNFIEVFFPRYFIHQEMKQL